MTVCSVVFELVVFLTDSIESALSFEPIMRVTQSQETEAV